MNASVLETTLEVREKGVAIGHRALSNEPRGYELRISINRRSRPYVAVVGVIVFSSWHVFLF